MTTDPETEAYEKAGRVFYDNIVADLTKEQLLTEILDAADGTLTEWRENNPKAAAEAEALAKALGFDLPHTDDYCWQAANAFRESLYETGGYGADVFTTVRVTLAGGGPAGWIEFTVDQDGDLRTATISYVDWFRTPITFDLDDDTAAFAYSRYSADVLAEQG